MLLHHLGLSSDYGTYSTLTCQEMSSHSLMPSPVWASGTLMSLLSSGLAWKLRHCALASWGATHDHAQISSHSTSDGLRARWPCRYDVGKLQSSILFTRLPQLALRTIGHRVCQTAGIGHVVESFESPYIGLSDIIMSATLHAPADSAGADQAPSEHDLCQSVPLCKRK